MLYRSVDKIFRASSLLAFVSALAGSRAARAAVTNVYTDNLSKTTAAAEGASGTRRLASSFKTGADATYLQSVTLLLSNTGAGQATRTRGARATPPARPGRPTMSTPCRCA